MKRKLVFLFLSILGLLLVGCAKEASTDIFRFETHQLTVQVGETKELLITGNFDKSSIIEYKIEGEEFATLDNNGKATITGVQPGTVVVIATVKGNEKLRAVANINIIHPRTSSILINKPVGYEDDKPIKINDKLTFTAEVTPANAGEVTWSTSDVTKATITQDGVFTAISGGNVFVMATSLDGKVTAKVPVKIEYDTATGMELVVAQNKSEAVTPTNNKIAYLRDTIVLKATILPNTADQSVIFTSSNPSIATVNESGQVFGTGVGKVKITATSATNSRIKKDIELEFIYAPLERIELQVPSAITITAGEKRQLLATVVPSNANPYILMALDTSNNINVYDTITGTIQKQYASINQVGNTIELEALYQGQTKVHIISAIDPTISTEIVVNVIERPAPTEISVTQKNAQLKETVGFFSASNKSGYFGDQVHYIFSEVTINATVTPAIAYQDLIVSISDESIAKVSSIEYVNGQTNIILAILKPGTFEVEISHKYANSYTELNTVKRTVRISEKEHEFDFNDKTLADKVYVNGEEYYSYLAGDLFFDHLVGDFEWRLRLGEGAVEDGAIIDNGFFAMYYILKPGTYYFDAVETYEEDGVTKERVIFSVRAVTRQEVFN